MTRAAHPGQTPQLDRDQGEVQDTAAASTYKSPTDAAAARAALGLSTFSVRLAGCQIDYIRVPNGTAAGIGASVAGLWHKPVGAVAHMIDLIGGAASGGGGRKGAAGSIRCGGGAGASGVANRSLRLDSAALPDTVHVLVGLGGLGAIAVTANDTNGNAGNAGGKTWFGDPGQGDALTYLEALGGAAGAGGTASTGTGGAATFGQTAGASASATGGVGGTGANSATPGAGAGGGITSGDSASAGGSAGVNTAIPSTTPAQGGAIETNGGVAPVLAQQLLVGFNGIQAGAGGGASKTAAAAGSGSAGSGPGMASGGGGAALNTTTPSAGGSADGQHGCIAIITWF